MQKLALIGFILLAVVMHYDITEMLLIGAKLHN